MSKIVFALVALVALISAVSADDREFSKVESQKLVDGGLSIEGGFIYIAGNSAEIQYVELAFNVNEIEEHLAVVAQVQNDIFEAYPEVEVINVHALAGVGGKALVSEVRR